MRLTFTIIFSFLCLQLAGCQSAPTKLELVKPEEIITPRSIDGVGNFAQVSPILYRGCQPTSRGFQVLHDEYGIKTVIDLRTTGDDQPLILASGREIKLIRLYAKPWHPEDEDVIVFLKALRDPANQPAFVHCAQGCDRTGWFIATYRLVEQNWNKNDAIYEMYHFGYHPIWWPIRSHLDNMDIVAIRKQVDAK